MGGEKTSAAGRFVDKRRKTPIHLPTFDQGNRSTVVFITVCTRDRRRILADAAVHRVLVNAWESANFWSVGRYVIMPDHVHLFASPSRLPPDSLQQWMRFWKSTSARNWPLAGERTVWQVHYWDRQLRSGESYSEKWEYVRNNPVRAGLVQKAEEWPYQGELNRLWWHDA